MRWLLPEDDTAGAAHRIRSKRPSSHALRRRRLQTAMGPLRLPRKPGGCNDARRGDSSDLDWHFSVSRRIQEARFGRVPICERHGARCDGQADHESRDRLGPTSCADCRRNDRNIVAKVGRYHNSVSSLDCRGWRPQRDSTGAEIHLHDEALTQLRSDDTFVKHLLVRQSQRLVRQHHAEKLERHIVDWYAHRGGSLGSSD